ncbi:MAG TPA: hypothetical protein VF219_17650 [Vicinamibacterales bacterium]
MAESRDLAGAAASSSTALTHYFLRAAAASVRTLHLYEQVIRCIARSQLTLPMLEEALAGVHLPDTEARFNRFFNELSQLAQRSEAAQSEYQTQLTGLAKGELTPGEFRRATSARFGRAVAEQLTDAAGLWFAFLGDLDEMRARCTEEYFLGMLREIRPIGFDADVIELDAPAGTVTSRVMSLENTRDEPALIRCAAGDVRRADGVGPALMPNLAITPAELLLDRKASIHISLKLDRAIYDADAPYIGALHVLRDGEPSLDLPLRITARNAP